MGVIGRFGEEVVIEEFWLVVKLVEELVMVLEVVAFEADAEFPLMALLDDTLVFALDDDLLVI